MSAQHTVCRDCGINAWWLDDGGGRNVHEDFYVHNELWDAACPDDECRTRTQGSYTFREGSFVLCIGCFERRLGRRLTRSDFMGPPRPSSTPWPPTGTLPSERFVDRWQTVPEQHEQLDLNAVIGVQRADPAQAWAPMEEAEQ